MNGIRILTSFFVMFYYFTLSECIATYSIDLSSEFIKVAIVKPGVPMEVALNGESQRKTPSVVYIKGDERLFGEPAMGMGVKYPKHLYHSIITLVGKTIVHSVVQDFIKNFPYYDIFMDENNQLAFRDGKNVYTVEELLGMIIEHSRNIAEIYSEMPMKGGIIVIPPYLTQDERHAVLRSAEIGGVQVLQMMNSNTAVGLNYGIFRRKSFNSTSQYYMFYDVGSSATVASIIGYQVVKNKEYGMMVENPQLSVVGIGFDRTLGGSQFALRLQKHMANAFNAAKKTKTDVHTVPRSMAKLYKEASRVLKVLSANSDTYAQVENVLDDQDFKLKITRSEFEEMCKDLFDRFSEPIHSALESAQIPMASIKEIILMGGGTRVPKIQNILLNMSKRKELGKGINTDEAAALGAVYQAAFISPGFKVQSFLIKDCNLVPLAVAFLRYKTKDHIEVTIPTTRMLFDFMNPFPQKKILTFNRQIKNFEFNVTQGSVDSGSKVLLQVSVDNMTLVYGQHMRSSKKQKTEFKGVKAHFEVDNSGLFSIKYIEALFERKKDHGVVEEVGTFEKLGNTISNFFGSSSEKVEKKESEITEKDKKSESVDEGGKDKEEGSGKKGVKESPNVTVVNATSTNDTVTKANDSLTSKVIQQNVHFVSILKTFEVPSERVKEKSRRSILRLKAIDDGKVALEKSKNELESYIFEVKARFEKKVYVQCSTVSERRAALEAAERVGEWYEEQGVTTGREEYAGKLAGLAELMRHVDLRVRELQARPEAVARLNSLLNTSNMFLDNLRNLSGPGPDKMFTTSEYESLWRVVNETTKWLGATNRTLLTMDLSKDPLVTVAHFEPRMQALEREMSYMINKISTWKSQTPPPAGTAPPPSPPTAEEPPRAGSGDGRGTTSGGPPISGKSKEARGEL